MIEAMAGQRINLTMYSFSATRVQAACPWTIVVRERNETVELAACSSGLGRRDRMIYTSQGHRMNFYLRVNNGYRTSVTDVRILLRYQVFGCADVISFSKLPHAQVSRDGDRIVIRCASSGQTYELSCIGEKWLGTVHSCDEDNTVIVSNGTNEQPEDKVMSDPFGLTGLVAIITVGVVIGLLLGALFLLVTIFCYRNRKSERYFCQTSNSLMPRDTFNDTVYLPHAFVPISTSCCDTLTGCRPDCCHWEKLNINGIYSQSAPEQSMPLAHLLN
jgi:hypothetical protein